MRSWRQARWRTRRIRSWAIRPSTSCSTRSRESARDPAADGSAARAEHPEHRHHPRRPRAQRHRRRSPRRNHDPPGGRFAPPPRRPSRDAVAGRAEAARSARNSRPCGWARWTAWKPRWWRSPPTFRRSAALGRAVSDRPGLHPRGAHARRARAQSGNSSKPSKSINAW